LGEALWAVPAAPEGQKRRAYQRTISGFFARQGGLNRAHAPVFPAMVSNRYPNPDSVFMKTDDVYAKGALVLHMLRMRLGDEAFFAGVRLYIQRFKFKEVETDDFRRCLEEASGESLHRFFDQWTARPGLPRLGITISWDAPAATLRIAADQTQRIDASNPAYAFELPILLKFKDKPSRTVYLVMDTRHAEGSWELSEAPVDVVVDPSISIAAPAEVTKSLPEPPPDPPAETPPEPQPQPESAEPAPTEGAH
jgi:aminopeptidase N